MTVLALTNPKTVPINRTDLRQRLRETLDRATGCTVVSITANDEEDEKLILDKKYFDEMIKSINSLVETLQITTDRKLFAQILAAAANLEENTRLGKLHPFEEAFPED